MAIHQRRESDLLQKWTWDVLGAKIKEESGPRDLLEGDTGERKGTSTATFEPETVLDLLLIRNDKSACRREKEP